MRLLSFDVGIKNLAFCDVEFGESATRVQGSGVLDVSGKTVAQTISNIVERLGSRFGDDSYSTILIENQPSFKNPRVKTVQTAIHTWFASRDPAPRVVLCSPKGKNSLCCVLNDEEPPKNYREGKKQAVRTTSAIMGSAFLPQGKGDDVADAFLQALHFFLRSKGPLSRDAFQKFIKIDHEQHA